MINATKAIAGDITSKVSEASTRSNTRFSEAKAEVEKGIECVEYGCALPNIAAGNQLEVSRGVACEVVYAPLGVVAGVTPFNFPLMVPLWMLPQALVGGNAFVMKPSERVPLSTMRLAELLKGTSRWSSSCAAARRSPSTPASPCRPT